MGTVTDAVSGGLPVDTLQIPACANTTWTSGVLFCKSVIIQGVAGSTILTSNFNGSMFQTDFAGPGNACPGKTIFITGLTIHNTLTAAEGFFYMNCDSCIIRIHHNNLDSATSARMFWMKRWTIQGLFDHNTDSGMGYMVEGQAVGEADANSGSVSWTNPPSFGTVNAVYLEDNTFSFPDHNSDMDCENGGRVVSRHNIYQKTGVYGSLSNTGPFDHGYDSVPRSCFELDTDDNTCTGGGDHCIQYRGASGLNYNNIISGTWDTNAIGLTNYRDSSGSIGQAGNNKGNFCDGTQGVDGNTAPTGTYQGWPCRDQIGRGQNQGSFPGYFWNNCTVSLGCTPGSGSAVPPTPYSSFGGTDYTTLHIVDNRDFYHETATNSGHGDGTAGVGQGTLTQRPATCTPNAVTGKGPGYFATNQGPNGTLYQCNTTNTWTVLYTPFQYPHPLQAAGGPAVGFNPTSLNFSGIAVYTSSSTQGIVLTNTGTTTLTISSITITGANSADYSQTNNCGASLTATSSCTITVTFSPTAVGARNASVSVADNASGSPHTAPLTGTGLDPVIYRASTFVDSGANVTNPTFAFDGDLSTLAFAHEQNTNLGGQTSYSIVYAGFKPIVTTPGTVSLYIVNAGYGGGQTDYDASASYSLDSGATWNTVWNVLPQGGSGSPLTDRIILPNTVDATKVQVRFQSLFCDPANCSVSEEINEIWIQTQDAHSQMQGIMVGTIQ